MRWIIVVGILAALFGTFLAIRGCMDRPGEPEIVTTAETDIPPIQPEPGEGPNPDGWLVDVGGHRLHIRTFGSGSPAVVIEPGIGDAGRVWGDVIDNLSEETRVVLYARAGYGQSDPGPMPRTSDRAARELDALLVGAGVELPCIVVAHSLGAVNALVYASENPHRVDGLVLLDLPPLGFIKGERFPALRAMADEMTAGFQRDAEAARDAGDTRQAAYMQAVASEHDEMFRSGWALVGSIESLGDMPLVVLTSGIPNPQFGEGALPVVHAWPLHPRSRQHPRPSRGCA
jgi:pimeloyl-ACP methyl ester carboxylesterase